jgi:hypothetical protein
MDHKQQEQVARHRWAVIAEAAALAAGRAGGRPAGRPGAPDRAQFGRATVRTGLAPPLP